jgi:hypothetical protein
LYNADYQIKYFGGGAQEWDEIRVAFLCRTYSAPIQLPVLSKPISAVMIISIPIVKPFLFLECIEAVRPL